MKMKPRPVDTLLILNEKEEAFVQEYARTGVGSKSYIATVNPEISLRSAEASARNYLAKPRVKKRLEQVLKIKKQISNESIKKKFKLSIDEVVEDVYNIAKTSTETTNNRLKAYDMLFRKLGLYQDKSVNINLDTNTVTVNHVSVERPSNDRAAIEILE
ncbi:MAG: terminase small subunit [Candidatus Omnitrophota bacterium]|jgi:hypothetical protein|nr:MAG: terminase small subunit [Candidatus Omnitrophota bacterium]